MRFIDLKLFLLLFACVGGAVLYESPVRFCTLVETRDPWDIAIVGRGYFSVMKEFDPEIQYTRTGKLRVNSNGQLIIRAAGQEWFVEPQMHVPGDWKAIYITDAGDVSVLQPGNSSPVAIGQFHLTNFDIYPVFNDDFSVNRLEDKYGQPTFSSPGTQGTGQILQGWLEQPAESATYRYAKPILIGSVIAVFLKVLLDAVLAQQKMQKLLQSKHALGELQ